MMQARELLSFSSSVDRSAPGAYQAQFSTLSSSDALLRCLSVIFGFNINYMQLRTRIEDAPIGSLLGLPAKK